MMEEHLADNQTDDCKVYVVIIPVLMYITSNGQNYGIPAVKGANSGPNLDVVFKKSERLFRMVPLNDSNMPTDYEYEGIVMSLLLRAFGRTPLNTVE